MVCVSIKKSVDFNPSVPALETDINSKQGDSEHRDFSSDEFQIRVDKD